MYVQNTMHGSYYKSMLFDPSWKRGGLNCLLLLNPELPLGYEAFVFHTYLPLLCAQLTSTQVATVVCICADTIEQQNNCS